MGCLNFYCQLCEKKEIVNKCAYIFQLIHSVSIMLVCLKLAELTQMDRLKSYTAGGMGAEFITGIINNHHII